MDEGESFPYTGGQTLSEGQDGMRKHNKQTDRDGPQIPSWCLLENLEAVES